MPTTPRYGLRTPPGDVPNDYPGTMQTLAQDAEDSLGTVDDALIAHRAATAAHGAAGAVAGTTTLAWTPVFNGLTLGNGSVAGDAVRLGRLVFCGARLSFGSTSVITTSLGLLFPVPALTGGSGASIGEATFLDVSDGISMRSGVITMASDLGANIWARGGGATFDVLRLVTATVPFVWAAPDTLRVAFWYLAAA
jgi:hypothetical protein